MGAMGKCTHLPVLSRAQSRLHGQASMLAHGTHKGSATLKPLLNRVRTSLRAARSHRRPDEFVDLSSMCERQQVPRMRHDLIGAAPARRKRRIAFSVNLKDRARIQCRRLPGQQRSDGPLPKYPFTAREANKSAGGPGCGHHRRFRRSAHRPAQRRRAHDPAERPQEPNGSGQPADVAAGRDQDACSCLQMSRGLQCDDPAERDAADQARMSRVEQAGHTFRVSIEGFIRERCGPLRDL